MSIELAHKPTRDNAMHGFISKWNETTIQASIDQVKMN